MTEHQIVSGVDRPNETPKERRERIKANEAEFARRRREDTPRDILRRRLDALNDDELYGGAAAAVRAVHKLAFSPVGYFECLIADTLTAWRGWRVTPSSTTTSAGAAAGMWRAGRDRPSRV